MRLPLSSAVRRCLARRLRTAARQAPVVAVAVAVATVVLPGAAFAVSSVAAASIGGSLADLELARLVVAGFAVSAAGAGAALAVSLPLQDSIDPALAAAPARLTDRSLALLLVPALVVLVCVAPLATATLLPIVAATPGGRGAFPGLALALAAAGGAAGCVMVAPRCLVRPEISGRIRGAVGVATSVVLALSTVAVLLSASAVAGRVAGASVAAVNAGAFLLCVLTFARLSLVRVAPTQPRGRSWRVPGPVVPATAVAGVALLTRRRDVATAIAGAALVGAAGLALGVLAQGPPPSGALVAVGGSVVVLAPVGLALSGVLCDGRHVWHVVPRARCLVVGMLATASCGVAAGAGAITIAVSVAVGEARGHDAPPLVALVAAGWLCAALAGAIVPWARAGGGGQAASLGAFGVIGGIAAVTFGRLAHTVPSGAPAGWAVWGAAASLAVAATLAWLVRLAGRVE